MAFDHLSSRINIGKLEIKNRLVMSPMQTGYADSRGFITDRQINYYVERARGGVGLIIVEHTGVLQQGKASPQMTLISKDEHIPGFKKLIQAIHREEIKIAVQLNHAGRQTSSITTKEPIVAPSPIPCPVKKEMPHKLTVPEIHHIVEAFAKAAGRAKKAGADAVEIHMAHGYLLSEFLSPFSNKREDEYGGDVEGRTRMPLKVLKAVREEVGPNFPISCRLSGDEYVEGGLRLEDTQPIARILEGGS